MGGVGAPLWHALSVREGSAMKTSTICAAVLVLCAGCDPVGCERGGGAPHAHGASGLAASAGPRLGVGKPAFASMGDASLLTDGAYRRPNAWTFTGCSPAAPCWAAVRVGAGPSRLLVDWSYQDGDGAFSTKAYGGTTVQGYTLQVSADSTNGADGTWRTATDAFGRGPVTVTDNVFIQRSHVLEFTGSAWIKMVITAATANELDELDLWDASAGTDDSYFFHGDSITQRCGNMRGTAPPYGQQPSFQAAVQAANAARYPLQTGGGIVAHNADDAVGELPAYLPAFQHVKYWFLVMGTNDSCAGAAVYATRAQRWIDAVKAAGHTPILVHPIWGNDVAAYCSVNGPAFNAAIDALVAKNGLLPPVPLYEATVGHPEYYGQGDVHPNAEGCHAWNRVFADAVKAFK